jgi:hypothetical protein
VGVSTLQFAVSSPLAQRDVVSNDKGTLRQVDALMQPIRHECSPDNTEMVASTLHEVPGERTIATRNRTANLKHLHLGRRAQRPNDTTKHATFQGPPIQSQTTSVTVPWLSNPKRCPLNVSIETVSWHWQHSHGWSGESRRCVSHADPPCDPCTRTPPPDCRTELLQVP